MANKKIIISFIFATLVIIGFFLLSYQKKVYMISGDDNKKPISENHATFLVLGKTGKVIGWNRSPDLADAVFVVDYRPKLGVINLVSLPRDLYIDLGGESFKLNEVVSAGKINYLLDKLPEITGLATDKFIVVNVDSLKTVVDNMEGIDIDLKEKAVDWVSGYTMETGPHHLNGDQAIWLVRNRFSPEGDFFREKNQHGVIQAIIDKFQKLNKIEQASFMFKITPEISNLQTNINFSELLPMVESIGNVRFNNVVLDFQTGLLKSSSVPVGTSSAYILLPRPGQDRYSEIKTFVENSLER